MNNAYLGYCDPDYGLPGLPINQSKLRIELHNQRRHNLTII